MRSRLSRKNAVCTPASTTTVTINYHDIGHILEIEFTSGVIYHYLNVPYSAWKEYMAVVASGGSSGNFLNTRIKPFYRCVKVSHN